MASLVCDIDSIKEIEDGLTSNKVAQFAYTQSAYNDNDADGVESYDYSQENNIPVANASILKVNDTVLNKGWRSQASSITRMLMNHFLGRVSYNLNKLNDNFSSLLASLKSYIGQANGIASLDENGRIPYSQLPESALELKGTWNASTNVWTGSDGTTGSLISGTGTLGDTYIVTTEGWFDSATGTGSATAVAGYEHYLVNGRIMYNGTDWVNISGGSQYALCTEDYFRAGAGSCVKVYGVAIGCNAVASAYGVAIGCCACNNSSEGVAIGDNAVTGDSSVAIGYDASDNGCTCAVAIGASAHAFADEGVAVGADTYVNATEGVAIGCSACTGGIEGISLGKEAKVSGNYGVSIGSSSCAGSQSVALGYNAGSYASSYVQTVAIGATARALGNYGVSIGTQAGASHYGDYNVAIGIYALYGASNSNSSYNMAIGPNTLRCLGCGSQNTAIGMNAGCAVTTGNNVTAIGYNALCKATVGSDHTAIGASALANLTTGLYNTAIGARALCGLTTGCENFGLGINAGWAITTGCNNVFIGNNTAQAIAGNSSENVVIGKNAMCESCNCTVSGTVIIGSKAGVKNRIGGNVFIGQYSGYVNTSGCDNTFLGQNSGCSNITGSENTFVGRWSGSSNTSGLDNTFIGVRSGTVNIAGTANSFLGSCSGFSNCTGNYNTFIGFQSGFSNSDGRYNTFIGSESGFFNDGTNNTFIGVRSGYANTTGRENTFVGEASGASTEIGTQNTFIGVTSGYNNTSGSYNTFIGYDSGCTHSSASARVIVGYGIHCVPNDYDFALGVDHVGTFRNYIFTCNVCGALYWCIGSCLYKIAQVSV